MVDMVAITAAQSLRSRVKGKLHLVDKSAPGTKQTADQQHVMRKEKKKNKKKEKEMCAQWKEADITIPDVISANEPQDLKQPNSVGKHRNHTGGGGGVAEQQRGLKQRAQWQYRKRRRRRQRRLTWLPSLMPRISGATYWGEPHMVDSTVPGAKNLDRPKSAILMADLSVLSTISMFSSFRSRCTMPAASFCSVHTKQHNMNSWAN